MPKKHKIVLLLAIWGERYIKEFGLVALPSYMSPENLPALATEAELQVRLMTSEASREAFETDPNISYLRDLCPIEYIYIDDLITNGNYGVTLTLAFARGIHASGADQTNTYFLFMNSDFILSDGSLRTLLQKMDEDHPCILAPSLRASSEQVLPPLGEKVDRVHGTLTMSHREMVSLAFNHLHPTVIAKTVTQDLTTCVTHNQIYWQVDEKALLARYFLIFMLAIKPEKPLGLINSYCDYGFIPSMVPSGRFYILSDSDEFFMLELQATHQESNYLRAGRSDPAEIAYQLSSWTTAEHRKFGEVDVFFHSEDRPADLARQKKEFGNFISSVTRKMRKSPMSYVDHYYWVLGLRAWSWLKWGDAAWLAQLPPEVEKPYSSDQIKSAESILSAESAWAKLQKLPQRAYIGIIHRVRHRKRAPDVPLWDHLWLDYRLVKEWTRGQSARSSVLALCDEASPLEQYFARRPSYDVRTDLDSVIVADSDLQQDTPPARQYDVIFLHIYRANMRKTRKLLKAVERLLKPQGKIVIFVEHRQSEIDPSNFSYELTQYLTDFLPEDWTRYRARAKFVGGSFKRKMRIAEKRALEHAKPGSLRDVPKFLAAVVKWPAIAAASAANNLWHSRASNICPEYCSSFLITLEQTPYESRHSAVMH